MPYQNPKATPFQSGVDKLDRTWLMERFRLNDIANAFKLFPLGGSRTNGIQQVAGTYDLLDYEEIELDGVLLAGFTITARVEVRIDVAGTTAVPVFWDVTSDAALVTGTAVAATDWTKQDLDIVLPAATRWYRPRVTVNNAAQQVFAKAYLEIIAP